MSFARLLIIPIPGLQKPRHIDSLLVCSGLSIPGGKGARLCHFLSLVCSLRCNKALGSQSMPHARYQTLTEFIPPSGIHPAGISSLTLISSSDSRASSAGLCCSLHWKQPVGRVTHLDAGKFHPLTASFIHWLQVRGRVRERSYTTRSKHIVLIEGWNSGSLPAFGASAWEKR